MKSFIKNAIKIGFISTKTKYFENLKSVCEKEYPFTRVGFKFIEKETSLDLILHQVLTMELDIVIIQTYELDNKTIKILKLLNNLKLDRKVTLTLIVEGKRLYHNNKITEFGADLIYFQNQDYESVLFNSIFSSKPRFVDRSRFAIGMLSEPYYKTTLVPLKIKHFGPTAMVASSDIVLKDKQYKCSGALFEKGIIGNSITKIQQSSKGEICYYDNPYCIKIQHTNPVRKVKGENFKSVLLKKRYREEEERLKVEKCKELIKDLPINKTEKTITSLVISKDFGFLSRGSAYIEDYNVHFSNSLNVTKQYFKKHRPEIIFLQLSSRDFVSNKKIYEEDVTALIDQVSECKNYKPIIMVFGAINDSEHFRVNLNYRRMFSAARNLKKMDIKVFTNGYMKALNKEDSISSEKNPDILATPLGNEHWADIFAEDDIRVHGMSENYLIFSSDNTYPVDSNFEIDLHGIRVSVKVIDYSVGKSGKMQIGVFHGIGESGKDHLRRLSQELYFISKNIKKTS